MIQNEIKKNENKGFSLVELIVVIAIMAVMAAVLAPSLLAYVEKSRAQKDDSAMGEVANAIQLALADQDVFDEVLTVTLKKNYSCYTDGYDGSGADDPHAIFLKAATDTVDEQWMYDDIARKADEKEYAADGNMRGATITFVPDANGSYVIADARINEIIKVSETTATHTTLGTLGGDKTGYLYNKVRATIGDSVELSSQTYRASDYTVFIRMGTTGGNQASAQDAIKVYGQWNGTNL